MIRRPPRSTAKPSSAASDVYKRQEFKDYSFSSRELPPFTKFQIKIDMVGTDQAQPPLIKELRAIALA